MARICWRLQVLINSRAPLCYGEQPIGRGILPQTLCLRNIGSGGQDDSDGRNSSDSRVSSLLSLQQLRTGGQPFGRLGGGGRPLSPLERISRLLPQETLSQEVWELREEKREDEMEGTQGGTLQGEGAADSSEGETLQALGDGIIDAQGQEERLGESQEEEDDERHAADEEAEVLVIGQEEEPDPAGGGPSSLPPGDRPLTFGEIALAEYRKKGHLDFKKMFKLQEGGHLHSTWGAIPHSAMVGCPAGSTYRSSTGAPFLIRRPTLDEYVLFMKRGPAIAYPKGGAAVPGVASMVTLPASTWEDASAMLMMMDVTEGDCVLESGSGSGAMSLFLSRAVGARGSVLSVEVRDDHYRRAVANYHRWRSAWWLRRGEEWPDNVQFHNADLRTAAHLLAGQGFHSVALDMLNPHLVLPTVCPHLHHGAVCAVYQANVTQVIDLLEGIRFAGLPLMCERVLEVQLRDWLLAPAIQKRDGKLVARIAPSPGNWEEEEAQPDEEQEEPRTNERRPFGAVPYIARPHPEQASHTAFLVKLRKVSPP